MAEFDDELDDIKPETKKSTPATKPATKSAPVTDEDEVAQPKTTTKAAASKKSADDVDAMDITFDDDKNVGGKGDGLNRVRPEKGKAKRFAFLPFLPLKAGKSHFVDGKGKFRCLTPNDAPQLEYCCDKLNKEGDMHICGLVVEYTNADSKTGKYEKGTPIEWEIGFVDMSRSNFRAVKKLPEEDQTVYDIDIVMTHADRAFGYEFNKVSSKARWKMNPDLAAEIEAAAQKFVRDGGKKLIGKLGKKATLADWQGLLQGQAGGADEASIGDLEDID